MKNKKKLLLLVLLLAAILVAAGLGYRYFSKIYSPPAQELPTQSGERQPVKAADVTVKNWDGEMVRLSDYFGKPCVVNFWATWCGPCKSELPAFQAMYEKYGDSIHFLMIDLTDGTAEPEDEVRAFIEENGYTFPVYFDTEFSAAETYAPPGVPATLYIDADGYVLDAVTGAMSTTALEAFFEKYSFVDPQS